MTPEQLERLPKWAREHIERLTRERDAACRLRDRLLDEQTPSPFYTTETVAEPGRLPATRYLPGVSRVHLRHQEIEAELYFDERGIGLAFVGSRFGRVGIMPQASNVIRLVRVED